MIDVNEYLSEFYKGTKNLSLEAMKYFMNKYNNFEKEMKFIHIAGTNGKGSCTEIISNILLKQGYKIGKFLSPHLIRYNERISINRKEISDEEMINLIEELKPIMNSYNEKENANITLFELETMMALLYFYRNKVDFVVLETGLGGLYDSTNIITKPLVSIITSIGYDHMRILGNSLQEIAFQKAGIIKNNSHTVIFEQQPDIDNVFISQCKNKNNILHIVRKNDITNYSFDANYQYFDYKDITQLCINLKGKIQIHNACLCIEAMKILNDIGYIVSKTSIQEGLKTVIHKGRMEQLNNNPIIIYDGAHNEPAMKNLQDMVNDYYKNMKRMYIISILKRKDYDKMLQLVAEDKNAIFILTSGTNPDMYASKEELYECMKKYTKMNQIYKMNLDDAIIHIMNNGFHTVNFIIGSFYIYGHVVQKIKEIRGC